MAKPQYIQLSAMSFDMAGAVKTEAHLLPAGDFEANGEQFKFNADIAANVIARLKERKNYTLVDYEHQSLLTRQNGQKVPAAGWFSELEYRADGLWATNIDWTDAAKAHIAAKEYRYVSAVFSFDTRTGEILNIWSFALTNTPAIDGLQDLAALSKQLNLNNDDPHLGDLNMSGQDLAALTKDVAALTSKVTALTNDLQQANTNIAALTAERDGLKTKLDATEAAAAAAALEAEKKAHGDLLTAALSDGRLAPAQKAWAEKQSLAALSEFLQVSTPLVDGKRQSGGAGGDANHGLSAEELAMCSKMAIDPKEFLAEKQKSAN